MEVMRLIGKSILRLEAFSALRTLLAPPGGASEIVPISNGNFREVPNEVS
jgi:hypothetical protein